LPAAEIEEPATPIAITAKVAAAVPIAEISSAVLVLREIRAAIALPWRYLSRVAIPLAIPSPILIPAPVFALPLLRKIRLGWLLNGCLLNRISSFAATPLRHIRSWSLWSRRSRISASACLVRRRRRPVLLRSGCLLGGRLSACPRPACARPAFSVVAVLRRRNDRK
jgi:hypothetical protein